MSYDKLIYEATANINTADEESEIVTVTTTSQTLADLGFTMDGILAVSVYPDGDINYNPQGTATATNGKLPSGGYKFFGEDAVQKAEFYASNVTMTVITHKLTGLST